jgi:hypothetical protein
VWFFSFLVWYSDVRKRYGDNLIILLDDPGLGLHAKAQWDLLRYIREQLVSHYQVLYATHSPFMIDPERMQWVRTVEEVSRQTPDGRLEYLGTKVGDEVFSMDHDTLLPLQASLGYRIMQDLTGTKKLLLVEKPADVLYLQWFSARLNERGRVGLHPSWTLVPCGDLVRLATLAGLLANDASGFAVLLTLSEVRPEITGHREVSRMLERCHVFPLHKYARPATSTVEDLLGPQMYLALTDDSYGLRRRYRLSRTVEQAADEPILKTVHSAFAARQETFARFDPMIPAEYLFRSKHRRIEKLPGADEAFARFETLFSGVNEIL